MLSEPLRSKSLQAAAAAGDASRPTTDQYLGMTGAQIFHDLMRQHGVKHVFGYPGGAILPVFDAIYESPHFNFILTRHEQGAGHMAEGYARASGKVGVVLVTSGPGATNTVTPLQDALMDGTPIIVPCPQEQGFKLTPGALEAAITPKTLWLILNAPSNPTGAAYSRAELEALGDVLLRHPHVFVLSDDIYDQVWFRDEPMTTLAAAVPEAALDGHPVGVLSVAADPGHHRRDGGRLH